VVVVDVERAVAVVVAAGAVVVDAPTAAPGFDDVEQAAASNTTVDVNNTVPARTLRSLRAKRTCVSCVRVAYLTRTSQVRNVIAAGGTRRA
jgi:hypothetical protein